VATFRLRKIRGPSVDPRYSADHGSLLHISAGDVIQQKCSLNRLYIKDVKQILKALFITVKFGTQSECYTLF